MLSSKNQEGLEPGTESVKITRWAKNQDNAFAFPAGKKYSLLIRVQGRGAILMSYWMSS